MPVVTMMTFQVGVSGVASRSRFTTPTLSSVVPSSSSAIGRMASVFPVPVPATMPNPRRERASSRTRGPIALLEERLDVQPHRELDGLARGARRRDDDHAAGRRLCPDERVVVGQVWISDVSNHASQTSKDETGSSCGAPCMAGTEARSCAHGEPANEKRPHRVARPFQTILINAC